MHTVAGMSGNALFLGHSSEGGGSSDEYYTSTSDTDPATDDEGYNELDLLVSQLDDLTQQNKDSEV